MAKLIFEGSTHADLVQQVRVWLTDVDGADILEGTVVVESPADDDVFEDKSSGDRPDVLRDLLRSLRKIAPGVVEDEAQLLSLLARVLGGGSSNRSGTDVPASVATLLQRFMESAQKANSGTDNDGPEDEPEDSFKDW